MSHSIEVEARILRSLESRLGRSTRWFRSVPEGAFVMVERDALLAPVAGWNVWASLEDPRGGAPRSGWNLWADSAREALERLDALGISWLDDEVTGVRWRAESMTLDCPPLAMRSPWTGSGPIIIYGGFLAIAGVILWAQGISLLAAMLIVGVPWGVVAGRRLAATMSVDHEGVHVRNTWSTFNLGWDEIQLVELRAIRSVYNINGSAEVAAIAFRVSGRRRMRRADGSVTVRKIDQAARLAAVRPWCLANGVPVSRG